MPLVGVGHFYAIGLLLVVLVIFGPDKLPGVAGAVGKAITELRRVADEVKEELARSIEKRAAVEAPPAEPAEPAGASAPGGGRPSLPPTPPPG